MKKIAISITLLALVASASFELGLGASHAESGNDMQLGAFSISLAVKDIKASNEFYGKLGFKKVAGDITHHWLILRNGDHVVGLFQGAFDRNTLTFNPGWDQRAQPVAAFTDVRELQRQLKAKGITPAPAADENSTGPASFMIMDPDGNPILFDQHR